MLSAGDRREMKGLVGPSASSSRRNVLNLSASKSIIDLVRKLQINSLSTQISPVHSENMQPFVEAIGRKSHLKDPRMADR